MIPILIPILAQIGAPILKKLLEDKIGSGVADTVVDTIAKKLGVDPTPEAIGAKYQADPVGTAIFVKQIEAEHADEWLAHLADRDSMIAREDTRETFFAWGWRPAMSWLVIFLFAWATVVLPLVNTAFKSSIPIPSMDSILQFSGIWLVIYGGGHTIKEVFAK
jgi:truncated hemoglobin YjbI